jgi:hypothetical protein
MLEGLVLYLLLHGYFLINKFFLLICLKVIILNDTVAHDFGRIGFDIDRHKLLLASLNLVPVERLVQEHGWIYWLWFL